METRIPRPYLHLAAFFAAYIAGLIGFAYLCGCSGQAFTASGGVVHEMGDAATSSGGAVGTGGVSVGAGGAGGARATGGTHPASGGAPSTGGVATATGGAVASTGGVATTGDAGGSDGATGGSSGDARAMGDAGGDAGDVGRTCVTDLSGVGTGDFRISFTLTTTESGLTIALLSQRTGCDQSSTFWDVSLSPTAGIVAATDDGVAAHYTFVEAGSAMNDGRPHKIDVIRRDGKLWYEHDGAIDSVQTSDSYAFGTFPPLVLGSSACVGTTPAAGYATISDVCITEP
jgi:hypothetical protein